MSDRVFVPLADGRWLALPIDAFREALALGSELGLSAPPAAPGLSPAESPAPAPASSLATADETLVDAETLAERFDIPASWIEQSAREGRLPCLQFGRWRRFKPSEVEAAIRAGREH